MLIGWASSILKSSRLTLSVHIIFAGDAIHKRLQHHDCCPHHIMKNTNNDGKKDESSRSNMDSRNFHHMAEDLSFLRDPQQLSSRLRDWESACQHKILPHQPFVVRLDGQGFSKFTSCFRKPWDIRIHEAMRRTTEDMLERFQCHTAYTISDEISLLFPRISAEAEQEEPLICHPYGGRVQKIVSLCASFCGVRFNYHLSNCKMEEGDKREDMEKALRGGKAHFDARVFAVPSNHHLLWSVYSRSVHDGYRNSVTTLAAAHFSHAARDSLPLRRLLDLLEEKGICHESQPEWYRFGVTVKKGQYTKVGINPVTGVKVEAKRSRIDSRVVRYDCGEYNLSQLYDLVTAAYWT